MGDIMAISPVVPVVIIEHAEDGPPLARALLRGGIGIIEVTLRSAAACDAIAAIHAEVPEMCVGAGTVWTDEDFTRAADAGAAFMVSPGASPAVTTAARASGMAYLPGGQTPTEIAALVAQGFVAVKLFPANVAGGVSALKALGAVFSGLKFCPTGGISAATMDEFLALSQVPCVGGSWITPAKLMAARDWDAIESLARAAVRR